MKRSSGFLAAAVAMISLTGCMSPQGRPDYTASGALAGGATGAILGSMAARHSGPGAVVGGAVGAVLGGIIGHGMDQEQEARLRAQAPRTFERVEQGQPLTVLDVEALSKAGIADDLIISQIQNSRTVYHLSTAEIISLKNAGVSDRVIDFMINTPSQSSSAQMAGAVGSEPPAPLQEDVVVAPGPDYVWVAGSWAWLGNRWVWHPGYWYRPIHAHRYGYRHW